MRGTSAAFDPCITILIWNCVNSSSGSPIPSSLIPALYEYSWKSKFDNDVETGYTLKEVDSTDNCIEAKVRKYKN